MRIVPAASQIQIDEIRKLFQEFAAALHFDLKFQKFDEEVKKLPGEYGPPTGSLFLAVDDKEIAYGCASLRKVDAKTGEMKRLYVKPEARKKGIGRQLAQAILESARGRGYQRVVLETTPHMKEAIDLFESLGSQKISAYRKNPIKGVLFFELWLK
jgi:ribosomal protein S18 acetylase RimI-like enzyme